MDASTRKALTEVTSILSALLSEDAPAKAAPKKAAKKTAPARKAVAPKVTFLSKKSRQAFVKAAPEFAGMSTKAIAMACWEDPSLVPAGFAIGEGYQALCANRYLSA